jgi:predicted nucleotidyltransferase
MSYDILVKTALKRQEAFRNRAKHLETIKKTVGKLDPEAETFVFGSVVEKEHNYSSDIDILIITRLHPAKIRSELWKAGIREPFEIHVHSPEKADSFKTRAKLVKIQ